MSIASRPPVEHPEKYERRRFCIVRFHNLFGDDGDSADGGVLEINQRLLILHEFGVESATSFGLMAGVGGCHGESPKQSRLVAAAFSSHRFGNGSV
jgi:hypothetical protein